MKTAVIFDAYDMIRELEKLILQEKGYDNIHAFDDAKKALDFVKELKEKMKKSKKKYEGVTRIIVHANSPNAEYLPENCPLLDNSVPSCIKTSDMEGVLNSAIREHEQKNYKGILFIGDCDGASLEGQCIYKR